MLTRTEKEEFVRNGIKAAKGYKAVAIVPLKGLPDRLFQSSRNRLKGDSVFLVGRKTLLTRILEGNAATKPLVKYLDDTSAVVLTNDDPFEFYAKLAALAIRLKAKPNQKAPAEIVIHSQETTLQPGQAVTELKQAGIDVQIQKGKVVISKDKVIKPGEVISTGMAKALHSLNITPFRASIEPSVVLSSNLMFTREVLGFNTEKMLSSMTLAFNSALQLSFALDIVNEYTVKELIAKAYRSAVCLGVEYNLYDAGIIERLIAKAVLSGSSIRVEEPAPAAEPTEQTNNDAK